MCCSLPAAMASPATPTTKVLPRCMWMYGATERNQGTKVKLKTVDMRRCGWTGGKVAESVRDRRIARRLPLRGRAGIVRAMHAVAIGFWGAFFGTAALMLVGALAAFAQSHHRVALTAALTALVSALFVGDLPGLAADRRPRHRSPPGGPCRRLHRRRAGTDAAGWTLGLLRERRQPARASGLRMVGAGRRARWAPAGCWIPRQALASARWWRSASPCSGCWSAFAAPGAATGWRGSRCAASPSCWSRWRAELDRAGPRGRALAGARRQRDGRHGVPRSHRGDAVAAVLVPDRIARGAGPGPRYDPSPGCNRPRPPATWWPRPSCASPGTRRGPWS